MSAAHGPTVAIMLSFMPDDLLGVQFYPNAVYALEKANYTPGKNTVDVSFVAKKDANNWIGTVQANGLSMIHEPGYEMVLAALRKICEAPAPPEITTKRTRVR